MCRRDQPRKRPKAPPKPFIRSPKSKARISSSFFTKVFCADKKKDAEENDFQYTFSLLIYNDI